MTKDLTNGKPMKLILDFAVPFLFGLLFQQFYNLVDSAIVGKCLGPDALAAVGVTGSLHFLIIGFCMGICNGFAIPVAQQFGAGNYQNLRKAVGNSTWLCGIFALVMTVATTIGCRQFLEWMRTPDDIIEAAHSYIVVIFAGIPVVFLYNMLAGIIRSLGDSRTPVIFLGIASVLNIGLDFAFILIFDMGVAGAAYATVISQFVSGVLCLFYMKKKFEILRMSKEEWRFDSHMSGILCGMGIPMGLQYSVTAIGSVILQSSVNTLGTPAVTAITAGSKVGMFFCCPFDALGSTMATYTGQNIGAGKTDRIGKGLKSALMLGAVYSVIAFVIMLFFARPLTLLFLNKGNADIMDMSKTYLLWNSAFYFPLAIVNIVRFMIQGLGFSRFAIFSGVFEMIARIIVAWAFVPMWGYTGACLANPLAWIFADAFLFPAYFGCMKKIQKMMQNN